MPFNGSGLVFQPFNTTFSSYTHLFGMSFFLIPVAFIGAALFMKTRDPVLVSLYFVIMSAMLIGAGVYMNAIGASILFSVVFILGFASLIYNVYYGGR